MKILYGFSNCSYRKYNELFKDTSVMVLQQAQKYHSLMTRGLRENGIDVQCISGLPINRTADKSLYIKGGNDEENGVGYHYFSSVNLPAIRQLMILLKVFFYILTRRRIDAAVCDILNLSVLIGMIAACRLRRIPIVGIVTDVPGKLADTKNSIDKRIDAFVMKRMDGYVFLTRWMDDIVNVNHKPYVVIEGQVDSRMRQSLNRLEDKSNPRVLLYAGSIKKIYGIKKLTEAFLTADCPGWELQVYGDGDFKEELIEICRTHPNIKYIGIKPNDVIVEAELRAYLLVNPRPTDEEYVKYSFPSKNMEYMVSGTPVITTHLPGMPDDYIEHVYLFDDESAEGMAKVLREVLSQSDETLHQKGEQAKAFVLRNKNQECQAAKVLELIKSIAE